MQILQRQMQVHIVQILHCTINSLTIPLVFGIETMHVYSEYQQ